jgi:SAM-dependent methyltransferase
VSADAASEALAELRPLLLDDGSLVRAIASGRRHGADPPAWRRADLRYVDLRDGRRLQRTLTDATQAHTTNHPLGDEAAAAVDALLAEPFGGWRVETRTQTHQVRFTKRGRAMIHVSERTTGPAPDHRHDREKVRLLPLDDPVFRAVGIADTDGRIKPSRQAKARQIEAFVRDLDAALDDALTAGAIREATADDPLRVADLGCGNAYLTFAAARHLERRGMAAVFTGVDQRPAARERNQPIARDLAMDVRFVDATIGDVVLEPAPEVVLALHACDTATDDALARAVGWRAGLILAAPCCHRDVARQLRGAETPFPALTRHGIVRERFADTLTDAIRASILRLEGYRVDVTEFVESKHTPRNTLLRAIRTGAAPTDAARAELEAMTATWHVQPALAARLP